jgi:hypothetical protein
VQRCTVTSELGRSLPFYTSSSAAAVQLYLLFLPNSNFNHLPASKVAMAFQDPERTANSTSLPYDIDPKKSQSPTLDPNSITASPASSTHLDDNYELYKNAKGIDADDAELKKVLRKIDYRIIPILFVTYMLQYLDKNSINFASVYGLQKGTNLVGDDYSWLGMSTSFLEE